MDERAHRECNPENIHDMVAVCGGIAELASHQTGYNSGVIRSGIYYPPGSLKARLTIEGGEKLAALRDKRGVPYERCGKVLVATEKEMPALKRLYVRGLEHGPDISGGSPQTR